jgi:annexin A13
MEFVSDADNLLELTNLMGYVAERDAFLVFKACDGIGTNDELLIKTLCSRTKKQINGISHYYKHLSGGQGLRSTIASECGGDYGEFMTFLCRDRKNFLNNRLQRALRGTLGCNKKLINELFCFSSTEDIQMMKEGFEGKKDKSLADKLRSKLMGEHESLIIYLLLNGRAEGPADESAAEEQAAELHKIFKNGAGMMGFKESAKREVGEFLAKHSADQMEAIKSEYHISHPLFLFIYTYTLHGRNILLNCSS